MFLTTFSRVTAGILVSARKTVKQDTKALLDEMEAALEKAREKCAEDHGASVRAAAGGGGAKAKGGGEEDAGDRRRSSGRKRKPDDEDEDEEGQDAEVEEEMEQELKLSEASLVAKS